MTQRNVRWADIVSRSRRIKTFFQSMQPMNVYGVPRGGCVPAALIGVPIDDPYKADLIVDDIVDSGQTRDRWAKLCPRTPFVTLFDKQGIDANEGWLVFPWETADEAAGPEDSVVRLLQHVGEDPQREGLIETPKRVLKSLAEQTSGYSESAESILSKTFTADCDELIVQRDIEFWSLCEHHLMPFHGRATVAYIPRYGRIVGISKLARVVHCYAKRLQIQERLTQQVATAVMEHLDALGAACVMRATHLCMAARGVKAPSETVTSCLLGVMREGAGRELMMLERTR